MPLSADDLRGSPGQSSDGSAVGSGVHLPTVPDGNPGPTRSRGVEPNTGKAEGVNISDPMYDTTPAGAFDTNQRSEPFNTPDSSGNDVVGAADPSWAGYDSARNNMVTPDWPQVGSFTKFGEHYPANGDQDGDGDTGPDTDHDGM
jgi:hypothetical protein